MLRRGYRCSFEMFRRNTLLSKRDNSQFSKGMPPVIPFELFLEELKRSEEERKRSEEELKRSKEERKRSEEDLKKFYELLMKEKEQECERLIEKKKQGYEQLIEVKEQRIKGLKQLIDHKDLAYKRLETEKLARESRIRAIATMSPFIEVACCHYSNKDNSKIAVQEFVQKELNNTEWLNARLTELEGNTLMLPDVRRALNELHNELSKGFYYRDLRHMSGFVCGGAKPLRMATALALLRLQYLRLISYEITYADESYRPLKNLSGGNVTDIRLD